MSEKFEYFMMKIDPEDKEKLRILAKATYRSMSAQVRHWIHKAWGEYNNGVDEIAEAEAVPA